MTIGQFNYIESSLWMVIAALLFFALLLGKIPTRLKANVMIAGLTFVVFGISDIVEASTGAWWRPLWLLALKAACIATLIGCYFKYMKYKKSHGKNA